MNIFEALKSIKKKADEVKENEVKIEMQRLIIELQSGILELQSDISTKSRQISQLESDMAKFRSSTELLGRVELRGNAYWLPEGDMKGPFCVACVHERGALNPLLQVAKSTTKATCPVCNHSINDVFNAEPGRVYLGTSRRSRRS